MNHDYVIISWIVLHEGTDREWSVPYIWRGRGGWASLKPIMSKNYLRWWAQTYGTRQKADRALANMRRRNHDDTGHSKLAENAGYCTLDDLVPPGGERINMNLFGD